MPKVVAFADSMIHKTKFVVHVAGLCFHLLLNRCVLT